MEEISTPGAPPAMGPYSQAIRIDNTVYVSGQGPLHPETADIVGTTTGEQTERVFKNIAAILEAGGISLNHIVKATVYLTDIDDYDTVNKVYAEHMSEPFPARSAVEVADLPAEINVEIEVIAAV